MAQKTVGYVELEWTCERCGTRNPGTAVECSACGAPMPEDAKFDLPASQQLITEKEKLERAKAGPDVHCPYCGARNVAGAKKCVQCSAPLGEAVARAHGQVLGAHHAGAAPDQPCPFCGELNPASAMKCKKCGGALGQPAAREAPPPPEEKKSKVGLGVTGALIAVLACISVIILFTMSRGTDEVWGRVDSVQWELSVPIMEMRPVQYETWADQIPAGAPVVSCSDKFHHTEQEPVAGAREICGTPYVIDQGSGTGKVVQDCQYDVYKDWCIYTVNEWQVITTLVASGNDLSPHWPDATLNFGQREGEDRQESYRVRFRTDDKKGEYTYRPNTAEEFSQFPPGSEWILTVNGLGGITDVAPAD